MKKEIVFRIKRMGTILLMGTLLVSAVTGCGKEEVTFVSEASDSDVIFSVEYEKFLGEEFNLIFADAQDGSYMQSMELLERPSDWTWEEILIQCGNANVEEFVLAGISFYEWKTVQVGNGQMEYLAVEEGDTLYSVGVLASKDSHYGVMIYGNFGEEVLLETVKKITLTKTGFEFELCGLIQNVSFSNRGKSLESYKVQFFENEAQIKAYLNQIGTELTTKQIREGREITLGERKGTAVGYGLDAKGEMFFAGQGQGSVACFGLINLSQDKGVLLLEYTNRSREGKVEMLPECFDTLERFFQ